MGSLLSMFTPQTLLVRLAFLAVMVVVCLGVGANLGYRYRDNSARVGTSTAVAKQANADAQAVEDQLKSQQQVQEEYQSAVEHGTDLSAELILAQQQLEATAQQAKRSIARVITVYKPTPGSAVQPIPHCVFTLGWVRRYNAALGLDVPASGAGATASGAGGIAGQAATASAADAGLLESGVTPADILAHTEDYGAYCRGLSDQVDKLVDFHGEGRRE